jgi:hypothetical protein
MSGPGTAVSSPRTAASLSCLFLLGLLLFLYSGYPFDGMVLSDGWYWYTYDEGEFRWPGRTHLEGDLQPKPYQPGWSALAVRRGLMPVAVMAIDHLIIGDKRVFLNGLCILVLGVNVGLFGYIVWRLGGVRPVYPVVLTAVLYPFASASHFWQHLILNNLAVTFFLLSLALFLSIRPFPRVVPGPAAVAVLSLGCYWLSILTVDYAVFMSPLFLYLALYYANGEQQLLRFKRWLSPYTVLGGLFIGLTLLAGILFSHDVPTSLVYAERYKELAERTGAPAAVIAPLTVIGNAVLFFLSAVTANTAGYGLYPAFTVAQNIAVLGESVWVLIGILELSAAAVWFWHGALRTSTSLPGRVHDPERTAFLLVVGGLWTLLAYLPFATALAYPRTVGLTADRINVLAQYGVAFCLGTLALRAFSRLAASGNRARTAGYVGLSLGAALLVSNLYLQREYYVETYRKEQQVARLILDSPVVKPHDARTPIVLLDRKQKRLFPRAQLLEAVGDGQASPRLLRMTRFVLDRYFLQDYVTSTFHMNGIMMFGCCPKSASITFEGYSKWLNVPAVMVYKNEPPLVLEEDAETYRIGYRNTEVWAKSFGTLRLVSYPKRDYVLLRLELDEAFFQLRGPLVYNVAPLTGDSA